MFSWAWSRVWYCNTNSSGICSGKYYSKISTRWCRLLTDEKSACGFHCLPDIVKNCQTFRVGPVMSALLNDENWGSLDTNILHIQDMPDLRYNEDFSIVHKGGNRFPAYIVEVAAGHWYILEHIYGYEFHHFIVHSRGKLLCPILKTDSGMNNDLTNIRIIDQINTSFPCSITPGRSCKTTLNRGKALTKSRVACPFPPPTSHTVIWVSHGSAAHGYTFKEIRQGQKRTKLDTWNQTFR